MNTDLSIIDTIIKQNNPDRIRIRYYPTYVDNMLARKGLRSVRTVKDMSDEDMSKLTSYLKKCKKAFGTFSEYGFKDTFIRVSALNTKESKNNSRIFFRRKLHTFTRNDFTGMFVLEMYNLCEEEDLPYVAAYQYDMTYSATTYVVENESGELRICFTKNDNESFTDINRDIEIGELENMDPSDKNSYSIVEAIIRFITDVTAFKNEFNLEI